jgi:hypothetical protein
MPSCGTSDPGQNIVAVRIPARSAVIQIGLRPPEGVQRLVVVHPIRHARQARILHDILDDTVAVGPEAGDERLVVGEGLGREGGPHRPGDPAGGERGEIGRDAALQIVRPEAVDRHEYGHRLAWAGQLSRGAARRGEGAQDEEEETDGAKRRHRPLVTAFARRAKPRAGSGNRG